ncbi:MAG: S41 family peptidase [Saprospiraceae bacterium]
MIKKYIFAATLIGIFSISANNYNNDKLFEILKNIEIYTNIYNELTTQYVDDLDPNELMKIGIDAMMHSLDPYTVYYSESQTASYRISTQGRYSGLGAKSMDMDGKLTIVELYEGGSSEKAGLSVGDQIIGVNGKSAEGKTYDEVLQAIRGVSGTDVKLTIKKAVTNKTVIATLTRSEINIPNVPYSGFVSNDIGYISLTIFTRNAGNNIAAEMRRMKKKNPDMKGLILDLRNNGGGLLAEAIDIVGIFISKGSPAVNTKGKVIERDRSFNTRRTPVDTELPLVILTNKNSASASEIVSGSIQDYDRGVIMGQRTFGKGLVQNHREVGYNSRIKLTTSKYYIPSGRCIQSREYENGEPKFIPDDERAVFYTKNKRPVLDGGGVAPDVALDAPVDPPFVNALKKEHLLFSYLNEYVINNTLPDTITDLNFAAYDEFLSFIDKQSFEYETATDRKFMELKKISEEEGYLDGISADIALIEQKIQTEKKDDRQQYKDIIINLLEEDLAQRLFYQEGKTRQKLKGDNEIKEAINLLNDKTRYDKILSGK